MELGIFRRKRRISNLCIALWLIIPTLVSSAAIAATVMETARNPWMHWSRSDYWMLAFFSAPALIFGFYFLIRNQKYRRSMKDFRVDEKAICRFEQEYRHGERRRIGKSVITEHWLFSYYAASTCLLPLKDVVWVYGNMLKSRTPTGEYWVCVVKLHFRNGTMLQVKRDKISLDRIMSEFAERCPQAQFGYSEERERAWKEEAKRWRISQ